MGKVYNKNIRLHLADCTEEFEEYLKTNDSVFLDKMAWWITDGAINGEPYGLFQCKSPYRNREEERSIAQFLEQEPAHIIGNINKLRLLFDQHVMDLIGNWYKERIELVLPEDERPTVKQWEELWAPEIEELCSLYGYHPGDKDGRWQTFLNLKIRSVVETWRNKAEQEAKKRLNNAISALLMSDLEMCVLMRLHGLFEEQRMTHPVAGVMVWLSNMSKQLGSYSPLEMGLFVNSTEFRKKWGGQNLVTIDRLYPIDQSWGSHIKIH